MTFNLTTSALEKEIRTIAATGVSGKISDYTSWVKMGVMLRLKEDVAIEESLVQEVLEKMKAAQDLDMNPQNPDEYRLVPNSPLAGKRIARDSYEVIGNLASNPMQYVRSRLEFFLLRNSVTEDKIVDLTIGTVEAIENCVKYGTGNVKVEYSINKQNAFEISVVNKIQHTDLEANLQQGKFSESNTLMRGLMVMEKLFDEVVLDINEDRNEALLSARKDVA